MVQQIKKGFTLIELLVVITIIGILATGATTVYTSQIQKSRDTTRISGVKSLQSGVEQWYQDKGEYPKADSTFSGVTTYVPNLPTDEKTGQPCNGGTACDYIYAVQKDDNSIEFGEYAISTGFENAGNVSGKAAKDGGDEAARYEVGLDLGNDGGTSKSTKCDRAASVTKPTPYAVLTNTNCAAAIANAGGYGTIFIAGN